MPSGHGTYQDLDPELLDPADENERTFLIEARHLELEDALRDDEEMIADGEPFSPRLHITLHQMVASQLLTDDPPETWQTVQRLAVAAAGTQAARAADDEHPQVRRLDHAGQP